MEASPILDDQSFLLHIFSFSEPEDFAHSISKGSVIDKSIPELRLDETVVAILSPIDNVNLLCGRIKKDEEIII